jgi:hypothetical protein
VVPVPGVGSVTCVSMYGLTDELSEASVHRSLSEISTLCLERKREPGRLANCRSGDCVPFSQYESDELAEQTSVHGEGRQGSCYYARRGDVSASQGTGVT